MMARKVPPRRLRATCRPSLREPSFSILIERIRIPGVWPASDQNVSA